MKFSVIMPCKLKDYPHAAPDREERFVFAVNSFLKQTFTDSELIIVSDGCEQTKSVYELLWRNNSRIRFFMTEDGGYFSGKPRQKGVEEAKSDLICYLDSDDFIGPLHLKIINDNFKSDQYDWCWYDDFHFEYTKNKMNIFNRRRVSLDPMRIGTCSICHKRDLDVKWPDGYGHDHGFINQLKKYSDKKIRPAQYYVCHLPDRKEIFDIKVEGIIITGNYI